MSLFQNKRNSFYHEPPMKDSIDLDQDLVDINELTQLLQQISAEKEIEENPNKLFLISIVNEDIQVSREKENLDKQYNEIIHELGEPIPETKDLNLKNEELKYINDNFSNSEVMANINNSLDKKKKQTEKLLKLWIDICNSTPQLKDCANLIDLKAIENSDNADLSKTFNSIVKQISSVLNNH